MIIKYWLPAIAIITALLTIIFMNEKTATALIYRGTNYRILTLSLGGWLAFKEQEIAKINPIFSFSMAAIIMVAYYFGQRAGVMNALLDLFLLSAVSIFIFLFAFNSANRSFLKWLFVNPLITYIGKISYGIYLYHFVFLYLFGITYNQVHNKPTHWQSIILPLVFSFVTASFSYFFIERYFLSLKNKLSAR
jgi:peptidoglycan/LPS O-acetylase OafA/YrhL